jgi:endonuclease IV
MLLLGAHCADTGGIPMAARRAGRAGMQALQVFTAIPSYYNEKVGVKPERVARFRAALDAAGIAPAHVLVHAAYVLNCATPDERARRRGWPRSWSGRRRWGRGASASTPGRPPTVTATRRWRA